MPEYQFQSNAGSAIQKFLLDQAARDRQAQLDAQAEAHQLELERMNRVQEARLAEQQAQVIKTSEQNRIKDAILSGGMGASVEPSLANTEIGKMLTSPSAPAVTNRVTPEMDLAKQQGIYPGIIASSAPSVGTSAEAPGRVSRGTVQEQGVAAALAREQKAGALLSGVTDRQAAMQTLLKAGYPAAEADTTVSAMFGPITSGPKTVLYRTKTGALAYDAEGKRPYTAEQLPQDYAIVNDPTAGAGAGGGTPYFTFIPSAGGVVPGNARTGEHFDPTANGGQGGWVTGAITPAPSEGIAKDLRNSVMVGNRIEHVRALFDPAKVGVIAGRLKGLQANYWGSDPEYAAFQQELIGLANTVIQNRTGAQMSVNEAERILKEVATGNLPVNTFVARLNELEKQNDEYMAFTAKSAYKKYSPEEIKGMTQGVLPTVPPVEHTAPTTPEKSKYKVTVSQ